MSLRASKISETIDTIELPTISTPSYQPLQHTLDVDGDKNSNSNVIATDYADDGDGNDCGVVDQRQNHHHRKHTGINRNKNLLPLIHRAKFELSRNYPHFSLLENDDGNNGNREEYQSFVALIDVQQSFAPASPMALLFRCVWLVASLLIEFMSFHVRYLNYLTDLSLIMTIMYQLMSCGMSLYAADFINGLGGGGGEKKEIIWRSAAAAAAAAACIHHTLRLDRLHRSVSSRVRGHVWVLEIHIRGQWTSAS